MSLESPFVILAIISGWIYVLFVALPNGLDKEQERQDMLNERYATTYISPADKMVIDWNNRND